MTSQTLPKAAHEHHERLLEHVNRIPDAADALLADKPEAACARIAEIRQFLDGTLLPHMEAAERALYPQLERMFQNRHSMAPMRREHDRIRDLVSEFGGLVDKDRGTVTLRRGGGVPADRGARCLGRRGRRGHGRPGPPRRGLVGARIPG
jgi:hypothetical protein